MVEDNQCKVCGLHGGISRQLKVLFTLSMGIMAVIVTSVAVSAAAWNASNKATNKLNVHSAGYEQRIKNIEQSLGRIEKLLEEK